MKGIELLEKVATIIVVVAVFLFAHKLYKKLFGSDDEENPLDITTDSTGLSRSDIEIYNKVSVNLMQGGDPFAWYNILVPMQDVTRGKALLQLGELLSKVENKPLFSKVWAKKHNSLLVTSIIDSYGQQAYTLVAKNVPNFVEFII